MSAGARARICIRAVDFLEEEEEIRELHRVCFDIRLKNFGHGFWWVAYLDDVAVAFAGLHASVQWERTGYLARAGVHPAARGHGLQRRLIRVRIAKARRLGWQWLVTDTVENPTSSNNLIECGFRAFEPAKPWATKAAAYWRLKL